MRRELRGGNLLKAACIAGFALALINSLGLVFFSVTQGKQVNLATTFADELRAYDLFDAPRRVLEGENPAQIEARLSRLQRQAKTVEEQLSALKRWRALAQIDRRYIASYANTAREAAEAYPYSSTIAAVAAEALLLSGEPHGATASSDLGLLRSYGERAAQSRFGLLELGIYLFAGDLDDPARAAALPGIDRLLSAAYSADFPGLPWQARMDLLVDDFLLRAYRRDSAGASQRLDAILGDAQALTRPELTRMAADFFYDHNNPLKAEKLFLALGGTVDLARAADSLYLAGEAPGARNIWFTLVTGRVDVDTSVGPVALPVEPAVIGLGYYNLAATAENREEELYWLEQSYSDRRIPWNAAAQDPMAGMAVFSTIRYSRLFDIERAIDFLDHARDNPLVDLEILRRGIDSLPPTRSTAEAWLLVGRHPASEAVHEWAAWFFSLKRLHAETDRLLLEAGRKGMGGPWYALQSGLALIRRGRADEAERLFREAAQGTPDWRILANLGRLSESRRALTMALEYYQSAAAFVSDRAEAAQVQMRLARCFEALGRAEESRRAVERAHELDPEDIAIRRELRRLGNP